MAILYSFRRCPYAIRARMMLQAGKAQYQHREILLKKKPASLLAYSPKGTVPVWITQGHVLDESMDIVTWCLQKLPPCQHLKLDKKDHIKALKLIEENDQDFKKALDLYKYHPEESLQHQQAWLQCQKYLIALNHQITDSLKLYGTKESFVDYALFPFVRQCYRCNPEKFSSLQLIKVEKWLEKLCISPLFEQVMKKQPLYQEHGQ